MDRYLSHFPTTKEGLMKVLGEQRTRLVLKELLEREWIRKVGELYSLTLVGEHALKRYLGAE